MEPRQKVTPFPVDGTDRKAEGGRRLFPIQPAEIAQKNDLSLPRILLFQMLEARFRARTSSSGDSIASSPSVGRRDATRRHAWRPFPAGLLDQDLSHRLRRGTEEVAAAVPEPARAVGPRRVACMPRARGRRCRVFPGRILAMRALARRRISL